MSIKDALEQRLEHQSGDSTRLFSPGRPDKSSSRRDLLRLKSINETSKADENPWALVLHRVIQRGVAMPKDRSRITSRPCCGGGMDWTNLSDTIDFQYFVIDTLLSPRPNPGLLKKLVLLVDRDLFVLILMLLATPLEEESPRVFGFDWSGFKKTTASFDPTSDLFDFVVGRSGSGNGDIKSSAGEEDQHQGEGGQPAGFTGSNQHGLAIDPKSNGPLGLVPRSRLHQVQAIVQLLKIRNDLSNDIESVISGILEMGVFGIGGGELDNFVLSHLQGSCTTVDVVDHSSQLIQIRILNLLDAFYLVLCFFWVLLCFFLLFSFFYMMFGSYFQFIKRIYDAFCIFLKDKIIYLEMRAIRAKCPA